jgi:hypothetical protein
VPELEGPKCAITVFDRHQDAMQFCPGYKLGLVIFISNYN